MSSLVFEKCLTFSIVSGVKYPVISSKCVRKLLRSNNMVWGIDENVALRDVMLKLNCRYMVAVKGSNSIKYFLAETPQQVLHLIRHVGASHVRYIVFLRGDGKLCSTRNLDGWRL